MRFSFCYSSKAGTITSTRLPSALSPSVREYSQVSPPASINNPSITLLSAALQENTGTARLYITQLFICPCLSLQHAFIHPQAQAQELQTPLVPFLLLSLPLTHTHAQQ